MRRRDFTKILGGAAAWPFASWAQQPAAVRRLGWFEPATPTALAERRSAFLEVLRASGYVEGKNLVVDYRYGHGKPETYAQIARELVVLKPDCILGFGVDIIQALRQATSTIPIVIGNIDADPVAEGFAASLSRPGGNITGFTGIAWELAGKRLQLLREIAPKAARLAVVTDLRTPAARAHLKETETAARSLKLQLQVHQAIDAESVDAAFREIRKAKAEALFVISVGAINTHRPQIARNAIAARLPAVYSHTEFVTDGGLMAYAPNLVIQIRRAATYVDRILKGAKPGDLPIEQPTTFELAVNLKTARAIGLTIPKSILGRADRVIE